jgi:hypothetical protein
MGRNEVIEPTEIVVESFSDEKVNYSHVSPWNRFLSRMFDYALFNIILFIIINLCFDTVPVKMYEKFLPIQLLLWIPIEAVLLSFFGYTPGKFMFKTTIRTKDNKKLVFKNSLKRSFAVWMKGMGLGIPVVNIFAMFIAFSKLQTQGITSWDRDEEIIISHYPIRLYRVGIVIIIIIISACIDFF